MISNKFLEKDYQYGQDELKKMLWRWCLWWLLNLWVIKILKSTQELCIAKKEMLHLKEDEKMFKKNYRRCYEDDACDDRPLDE